MKGPSNPGRESYRLADETKVKAPFPAKERNALARGYRSLGPNFNICLKRKTDWVTGDGRFATELAIDGELSETLAERHQVRQQICRFITNLGHWEKDHPNVLKFRSKLLSISLKLFRLG